MALMPNMHRGEQQPPAQERLLGLSGRRLVGGGALFDDARQEDQQRQPGGQRRNPNVVARRDLWASRSSGGEGPVGQRVEREEHEVVATTAAANHTAIDATRPRGSTADGVKVTSV